LAMSGLAYGQWIHVPIPGTPRTKDGKPDLSAPAPRTATGKPDLSGIWQYQAPPRPGGARASGPPAAANAGSAPRPDGLTNLLVKGDSIEPLPWAEALYKQRRANNSVGLPSEHCLPHGPPEGYMIPIPFKILQTPAEVAILFEEFNYFRQIFTDGRGHPPIETPAWYGYSVGKWDQDTLVVDTIGYNDRTWLTISGYPHTEALHTVERITRPDFGHLNVLMTIDDPKAYKKPFSIQLHFNLEPDTELIEEVCDNERDAAHMVGK
ncbi:MAG TPA: hypothetical protein VJ732_19100, partial [Bryobacteraceae bacterium]|nr:hypothetical protein [Bryobacteraceae bacterium]